MIVHSADPLNAEPTRAALAESPMAVNADILTPTLRPTSRPARSP